MVRTFQSEDLNRTAEIWLEANTSAHHFIPGQYWEEQLEAVKAALPRAEVAVCQDESGEVQGFIGLSGGHIEGIFVAASARCRGLGKQLLDYAKADHSRLTLNVYQKNGRAVTFYFREGFQLLDESIDRNTGEAEYRMIWEKRGC